MELTEPTLGVGPLRPIVHPLDDGEFHVIADVPLAGTYGMVIRVRVSDFVAVERDISGDHRRLNPALCHITGRRGPVM